MRPPEAHPELAALVDHLPEVVFTVDAEGRWSFLSRAFTALTGIRVDAALGRPAREVLGGGDFAALCAGLATDLHTELPIVHRDESRRWVEIRARRRPQGGVAGTLTDVTDRRVAERHARAEGAVTAMLVADHTAEDAVQHLLRTLGAELGWDAGELWTQNAATGELRCTQVWARNGLEPPPIDDTITFGPGEGLPGRTWNERRPVWIEALGLGVGTAVGFPVLSGGRPLAVLTLFSSTSRPHDAALDRLLTRVGVHAGAFIDRKVAQRRMAEQADDLAVLGRVAHRLAEQTDATAARAAICEATRDVTGASAVLLFEPDAAGEALELRATVGVPATPLAVPLGRAGAGAGAVVAFETGHAQFVSRLAGTRAMDAATRALTGARSAVWQPVLREGAAVGVIVAAWEAEVGELPDRVPGMLQVLAADAAVAFERAALLEKLTSMALSDSLTGVANRRAWERELERELARAGRYESSLCLALLDLDCFKRYNDAHGHQAGDELLVSAAEAWRSGLRPTDLLARYGGEEFAVLLPHTLLDDALVVVRRLRVLTPSRQTCSARLGTWDGGEAAASLVRRADMARYEAKAAGRTRAVCGLSRARSGLPHP